ncbi:MAG: hypothetical protein ACK5B9_05500 [Flavobacteriia bacterium]|jgi:hypothetical protein
MKKNVYFITLGCMLLISCKKTFTCDCNATLSEGTINYKHTIKNETEKNATVECQNIEYNTDQEYRLKGGSYICDLR